MRTLPGVGALVAVALASTGCVTVLEQVYRRDAPLGDGKVLEERAVASAVTARAELRGSELLIWLEQQQTCQRRIEEKVRHVDRVERRLHPYSYSVLGCELLGGCLASAVAVSALLMPAAATDVALVNRLLWAIGATAVAGWLFGSAGYQIYFLNDEGERTSEERAERWTAVEQCRSSPLAGTDVSASIGAVALRGRTSGNGGVALTAPSGIDLASLLAGAGWKIQVAVATPPTNLTVDVAPPAGASARVGGKRRAPRAAPGPGATAAPAAAPETPPRASAAQPAPPAAGYGDEPPVLDGPPAGLPPQAPDASGG
ncbi:MAG: hypothetical protein JXR83_13840 [Deltaproteobacteria bacterium]|nr:hypothetical protein [Deltaproteobacteria bacterium]